MMESFNNLSDQIVKQNDDPMVLLPGFRFHPTDEELITHYLSNKVIDNNFCAKAIGEADMNRIEPWELPRLAKMGEKEWYFFCLRDKKYPTGMRTNRATAGGYWKATGKDKEIFRRKLLVGMKKTLVFYKGRAPKGEKTNWVIHEFRLEGKSCQRLSKSIKNEWVICRVFYKISGGNKANISGLLTTSSAAPSSLPPLINSPVEVHGDKIQKPIISEPNHVPCFSNINNLDYNFAPKIDHLRLGNSCSTDQSILRGLIDNYGRNIKLERKMVTGSYHKGLSTELNAENSSVMLNFEMGKNRFEDQETPSTSIGGIDIGCLWN